MVDIKIESMINGVIVDDEIEEVDVFMMDGSRMFTTSGGQSAAVIWRWRNTV